MSRRAARESGRKVPFGTIGTMRGRLRAGAIGAVLFLAGVALPAPVAVAGVDGEATYSVGLRSQVSFRHYGDSLYVTDLSNDGMCAVGLISRYITVGPSPHDSDVEVVLNCNGSGTTVRKSFAHIPEGSVIHYYACWTDDIQSNYARSCGAPVSAIA